MSRPLADLHEHDALKRILEGTSRETGEAFFRALVRALATALGVHGAWVTRLDKAADALDSYALWLDGQWVDGYRYGIAGTPCEGVVRECRIVHVPDRVVELFPRDPDLQPMGAVSYLGVPFVDSTGAVTGHLAVLDRRPMPEDPRALAIIRIFAARAEAEVARLEAERALRESEAQVRGLFDSAIDAIVWLDADLNVVRANPSAEKVLGASLENLRGRPWTTFLTRESVSKLRRYLDASASAWISGGLECRRADGAPFPAEASVARFATARGRFASVIFRDVDERRRAEQRIETLERESEALREELRQVEGAPEILGAAPPLREMLREVAQVAATDTTVLVQGETGTGKELVARAIHAASARRGQPLIRVNCGAIPATLIESELFGHERGAYTGATARRDGRFLLADRGTIFLDEIGELPLELQVKLLRVLQEGEFEPVGSSRTRKIDVRVIAATNRVLEGEVRAGRFREDLYYRLNVFPVRVPALRERKSDIPILVEAFARRLSAKLGRRLDPICAEDLRRLADHDWPGNVRELHNVIERAVITAREGRLDVYRAMGAGTRWPTATVSGDPDDEAGARVHTRRQMDEFERANVRLALERAGWKISGEHGAAALLGMRPSTLTSRMKALGIAREKS